jgi:flagellin-like hook-associated protein FlgL
MSSIVLSASVRQNLLSLQSTASLLATTQNDLATGNKVNSALDNPTSYFTAAALNNRASDINNLLDGIGNGVQVLQAANTGITSLQSLVASAQSVANQVLQTPIGYSAKSSISSAQITGATANNLLGTAGAATNAVATATSAITPINLSDTAATNAKATGTANLSGGLTDPGSNVTFTINSQTVTLTTGTGTGTSGAFTLANIENAINTQVGSTASVNATDDGAGHLILTSTGTAGASDAITTTGTAAGLGIANTTVNGAAIVPHANLTFKVNNQTVTLTHGSSYTGAQIATAIQSQVGTTAGVTASYSSGKLAITSTGTAGASDQVLVGTFNSGDATQLGFATATETANGAAATGGLSGQILTIAATGGGQPTTITFGTTGTNVSTLNQLNAQLATNNLQATIDSTGVITITTSNNAASSTIGIVGGSATTAGNAFAAFAGVGGAAATLDPNAQATRAGLISQYNNILKQIDTTSQDSSFNGVNLLEGDTLNLTFDETGKSTLAISGVTFNTAGLGLSTLSAGTDFLDSNSANKVIASLGNASNSLRSQASALGSNLSIVQIRQDFSKSLINVLQTGASNLTLADTNEEAANSQALSTRQSIAVSALALANQSQQSVLQLLR